MRLTTQTARRKPSKRFHTASYESWAHRLELTLPNRLESVEASQQAAELVAANLGFEEEAQYRIGLAVRECLANAMVHGNGADSNKTIGLKFLFCPDSLLVQVQDSGPGFDPALVPDPRQGMNRLKSSGRGLLLARTFVDELWVARNGNGCCVNLRVYRDFQGRFDRPPAPTTRRRGRPPTP
ncbi:MAG TPA: ATP-binding protein [Candidatus Xenobia bacterium]|nr:ATP-binding protein [Candidatus Xenobia bacterium]